MGRLGEIAARYLLLRAESMGLMGEIKKRISGDSGGWTVGA